MKLKNTLVSAAFAVTALMPGMALAETIGFSQVGSEGDWRPAFSANMRESAKEYGVELKFSNAQGKQEEQLRAVRAFIAQEIGRASCRERV